MIDVPEAFGNARPPGDWWVDPTLWVPAMIATPDHPDYDLALSLTIHDTYVEWGNGFKTFEEELVSAPTVEGDTIILPFTSGDATVRPITPDDLEGEILLSPEATEPRPGEAFHSWLTRVVWERPTT